MSDIAELTAKIRIDDVQFVNEQPHLIKLSEQLNIKFDQIKQTVSGYARKITTASVEIKQLSKNQSSLASFTDMSAAALNKNNTSLSEASKKYKRLSKSVLQAKSAFEAFAGVSVATASLGTVEQFCSEINKLKKAGTNIEKMTAAAEQNAAVTSKWTLNLQALQKEVIQLKASSKEIASIGLVSGSANEVKHVRGEVEKLKGELDKVKATAPELKNAFSSIAKYAIGAFSINEVKGMMDAYTTLTNRIKLVTNSEKELKEVRVELTRISSSTGQNLDATAAIYQRLAQATDQTGLSGEKLLNITDLISKAMVIGGGSAQSQENALIQLGQAMASGRLSGEELNSVLEQAPGLAMAIAKGMGVSVGALKTLGSSGKITSQQLADAILKQSAQIQSDFSKTSRTIDQALQNIKTQLTMFNGDEIIKEDLYGKFPHLYPKVFVTILILVAIGQLFTAFCHSSRSNILSGCCLLWSALIWFVISGTFIAAYPPLSTGMTTYPLIAIICALAGRNLIKNTQQAEDKKGGK